MISVRIGDIECNGMGIAGTTHLDFCIFKVAVDRTTAAYVHIKIGCHVGLFYFNCVIPRRKR